MLWGFGLYLRSEPHLRVLFATTIAANCTFLVGELRGESAGTTWQKLRLPIGAAVLALDIACFHWGRYPPSPVID